MMGSKFSFFDPAAGYVIEETDAKNPTYFCLNPPLTVGDNIVEEMLEISRLNSGSDVRLCLHRDPAARQHDMIVVEHRKNYYRPHKHLDKFDVLHVMRGSMLIFVFTETGQITQSIEMGTGDICRIPVNIYHTEIPIDAPVVFHENRPGPFDAANDSFFAPWAPENEDPLAPESFTRNLERRHLANVP